MNLPVPEIWKDVKDFEGCYQVSNLGRIKSLERVIVNCLGVRSRLKEKIRKPVKDEKGYLRIVLVLKSKYYPKKIHRLVLENFLYESKLQVNHMNGVKSDNSLSNLEYVTNAQNMNHRNTVIKRQKKYGIYLRKDTNKWQAVIMFEKKKKSLGCFKDKEKAYQAFHDAYLFSHGVTPW